MGGRVDGQAGGGRTRQAPLHWDRRLGCLRASPGGGNSAVESDSHWLAVESRFPARSELTFSRPVKPMRLPGELLRGQPPAEAVPRHGEDPVRQRCAGGGHDPLLVGAGGYCSELLSTASWWGCVPRCWPLPCPCKAHLGVHAWLCGIATCPFCVPPPPLPPPHTHAHVPSPK